MFHAFKFKKGNSMEFEDVSQLDSALGTGEAVYIIETGKIYAGEGEFAELINPDAEPPLVTVVEKPSIVDTDTIILLDSEDDNNTKSTGFKELILSVMGNENFIMDGGMF